MFFLLGGNQSYYHWKIHCLYTRITKQKEGNKLLGKYIKYKRIPSNLNGHK